MTRAYLDHASTSPLRPTVLAAMLPFLSESFGDPGRLHQEGHFTRVAVETAREQVAVLFGAHPREVVFTATGTESVNAAIWGATNRSFAEPQGKSHIVTSQVESSCVLDACARSGYEITAVGVDNCGRFLVEEVIEAFQPETVFLTLQLANHEVGTIQSAIPEILAVAKERGILTHVDARAAAGHLKLDFADLGADLCSITADTWGGPLGSAALLIKRGLRISPLLVGGMQERARRGGSENVAAIVGFGSAANEIWAGDQLDIEARLARQYTDQIIAGSLALPGVQQLGDPKQRLPHLVCIAVNDVESEPILLGLDQHGVAVHSGSSCSSEALEPSPVLTAMGVDADKSLRVSSGWSTTKKDIDTFLTEFPLVLNRLRELRNG